MSQGRTDRVTRREFVAASSAFALSGAWSATGAPAPWRRLEARRPVPTPAQLLWQRDELALFVHFGVNTFTDREWGDGTESPALFAPTRLDPRRWARTARAAGFRAMVLTAKHHDGFCLWPTRTTNHSVARSPWRSGAGDVVRDFVDACRAEGLRAGLYCSPWDRNAPSYGDSPRYNDLYAEQLTELMTWYGPLHQIWFDGANGEGPTGRRQEYDWPRTWALVRRLQPDAVVFSDAGPDVRWIGNERGVAGDPNWSPVDPSVVPVPGMWSEAVERQLQHGDEGGTVWRPGEADVSIRPGWFHHPAEDGRVRSVDDLVDLFFSSVGRNSKLLLNVPPTRDGLFHDTDAARLAGLRGRLDALFADDLASGGEVRWSRGAGTGLVGEMDLLRPGRVAIVELREDVTRGQTLARHRVEGRDEGGWTVLAEGTTVGYRRLHRLEATRLSSLRITLEDAWGEPPRVEVSAWAG